MTTQPYSQGQAVKFDFMNKGTGMMLDIAMGDDLKVRMVRRAIGGSL